MTAAYTPLRQSRDLDVETPESDSTTQKPFRLSLPEKQVAGLLFFFWLACVWVALKVMESTHAGHRKPLLPTTDALLDTSVSEIYESLTLPLLQIANRTQLISNRCGVVSLPPHLLSFLDNDLHSQREQEEDKRKIATTTLQTRDAANSHEQVDSFLGAKASRYLFALVVQDAEEVLPDTFTRIIEAIAILGPNECHLSIVDHGSVDGTKQMIKILTGYLDRYNHEQQQQQQQQQQQGVEEEKNSATPMSTPRDKGKGDSQKKQLSTDAIGKEHAGDRKRETKESIPKHSSSNIHTITTTKRMQQHITYNVITMGNKDNSPLNLVRVKNLALSPMFPRLQQEEEERENMTVAQEMLQLSEVPDPETKQFDHVVFMDAVVTCTEDILELIYQSHLQNADLVCGLDLSTQESNENSIVASPRVSVMDTSAMRDILGHTFESTKESFSSDRTTLTRFKKRLPFQVSACWSGAVVIRGSPLTSSAQLTFRTSASADTTTDDNSSECAADASSNLLFNLDLWKTKKQQQQQQSSAIATVVPDDTSNNAIARMVVVPTSQFQYSRDDYAALGTFDAWGLWSKPEQTFREEHEAQLREACHRPQYVYQPATGRYGYVSRVQEQVIETTQQRTMDGDENDGDGGSRQEQILADTDTQLMHKLETIGAVFGVRDIEDAVVAKRESDLIDTWRDQVTPIVWGALS
ncbi:capsular associated protein [Podila humilis]|nr:capsular associated protein [Podila humilis]